MKFEWDEDKNLTNIEKHGISFEEATRHFSTQSAKSVSTPNIRAPRCAITASEKLLTEF
ncbi:MAG: hypothetical protein GX640_12810 [Fibrobacter sp.]|nr:hypothetical protein [Fibrobacter sp.]